MAGFIDYVHALAAGVLVGKVVFLSFVVAPILARTLDPESFGKVVRQLFQAYYALGMGVAAAGTVSAATLAAFRGINMTMVSAVVVWLLVFTAESYCRSPLTLQSNAMRDRLKDQEARGVVDTDLKIAWDRLHQRSLYLNSAVLCAGLSLVALAP